MKTKPQQKDRFESIVVGLTGAGVLLFIDLLMFSTLLLRDSVLQKIFYGPLLILDSFLTYGQRKWGWPIPMTMFGGFSDWINWLLLFINWAIYAVIGFRIGQWLYKRKEVNDET